MRSLVKILSHVDFAAQDPDRPPSWLYVGWCDPCDFLPVSMDKDFHTSLNLPQDRQQRRGQIPDIDDFRHLLPP